MKPWKILFTLLGWVILAVVIVIPITFVIALAVDHR